MTLDQLMPVIGALALFALVYGRRFTAIARRMLGLRKRSQVRREKSAARVLKKLTTIERPEQQLAYLRKIDPFTFEELVLTAFQRRGQKIQRNARYTGDGGIDGQVWIKGKRYLVQAKRYRRHISAQHVRDFCALVDREDTWGIFVHTGRTGKQTRTIADDHNRVTIISGRRLLKLLEPAPAAGDPNRVRQNEKPMRPRQSPKPSTATQQSPMPSTSPHQNNLDI